MIPLVPTLSKISDQWKPARRRELKLATPQKSFVCGFDFSRAVFLPCLRQGFGGHFNNFGVRSII